MKDLKDIKEKLAREEDTASELLKLHLEECSLDDNMIVEGTYLRMYNKVQERIYTLEWVLELIED